MMFSSHMDSFLQVAGLGDSLGLKGIQFNIALAILYVTWPSLLCSVLLQRPHFCEIPSHHLCSYVGYILVEIPSNHILRRVGARVCHQISIPSSIMDVHD